MTIDYTDRKVYITNDVQSPLVDFPIVPGKSVICIGRGTSRGTWMINHRNDPDAEIWTINCERISAKPDRHFQIHDMTKASEFDRKNYDCSDLEGTHVYYADNYPFEKIRRIFHHSTVDYMLAIADMEGFETVYMPGLDFAGCRKEIEIHSARYWIGVLEGKGCNVIRSPMSRIFQGELYKDLAPGGYTPIERCGNG